MVSPLRNRQIEGENKTRFLCSSLFKSQHHIIENCTEGQAILHHGLPVHGILESRNADSGFYTAFVGGLSISMALMVSPFATSTTRLFGTRVTLFIGVALEALALIGASFTHETWQLFLSQGVCFGLGMGFLFVGSVGVVPQWFTKKRSLANGIATAGSGLGGMTYSLATNAMIQSLGVSWAFRSKFWRTSNSRVHVTSRVTGHIW